MAADQVVDQAGRSTTSRRELARHDQFEDVSPELGQLDEQALQESLEDDPDAALALLADLANATDANLRELARQLAGRIVVDLARRGATRRRGVGHMHEHRLDENSDLDIDASMDALAARDLSGLRARGWTKPATAWCLIVDRSGSMGGERLATAAVAAASMAWRAPSDYSVLAFAADVIVVKSQDVPKPAERVVNDLLALRGHGTTDLALALRAAYEQLHRSRAGRRIAVLLSDCRPTVAGDVARAGALIDELIIVPPADDADDAQRLASSLGARCLPISGPSEFPALLGGVV